jgi:esterase/lipase superfamily enzyme
MEQVPVPPIRPGVTGTVWYGTNRRPISSSNAGTGYSAELDDSIHYGRCKVYVPQSHEIGSLGSSWWKRFRTGTDDRLKVVSVEALEQSAYWLGVRDALSTLAPGRRDLLVFLHGYNVSFEGAALRAAQISSDLNFLGPTAFFSWPSRGAMSIPAYLADGTAIDASENQIAEFLIACAESSGAKRIHVIAHSMGNRGLLRAMNRVVLTAASATGARFGHVILAAPDVDQNLFRQHAAVYHRVAQRTTLYVSDKDLALKSSGIIYGQPRAGFVPPVTTIPDMDTVYVANVDLTVLGHGYVSSAGGVLGDMHDLLTLDAPPWQRRFIKLVTERHQTYWRIAKVAQ